MDTTATGNYYTINHVALITGLTARTLRNYISMGLLEGEKINGLWHFSPEAVDAFIRHPTVRPSILAKHNAIVYDFLLDTNKRSGVMCVILDLPDADRKQMAEFFCYRISNEGYSDIRFAFQGLDDVPRAILKGNPEDVMQLVGQYQREVQISP